MSDNSLPVDVVKPNSISGLFLSYFFVVAIEDMDLWISDVDGVLTNLLAEPTPEVLRLTAALGAKQPFCYITGRAAAWLEQNIVPTLTEAYKEHSPFSSFLGA